MKYRVLISGANRGIGLEFVQQYLESGYEVIACCREPERASELLALGKKNSNLNIRKLNVTNEKELKDLAASLDGIPLDILINNAGIYGNGDQSFEGVTAASMIEVFTVNSVAPLMATRALLANILKGQLKTVINISSLMGSISDNGSGGKYAYRPSKTAINMITKSMAVDLAAKGLKVLSLHPGWVQTDMGGSNAPLDVKTSVSGMISVINSKTRLEANPHGDLFLNYNGKSLEW